MIKIKERYERIYNVVLDEIKLLPINETEKKELEEELSKLPKGFINVASYASKLKKLLIKIESKGGNMNRIAENIEKATK